MNKDSPANYYRRDLHMFLLSWSPYHVAPSAEVCWRRVWTFPSRGCLTGTTIYIVITMATAWITVIPYCNNLRLGREVTVANLFSSGQNFSREMKLDW